jgi:hypothetical protein
MLIDTGKKIPAQACGYQNSELGQLTIIKDTESRENTYLLVMSLLPELITVQQLMVNNQTCPKSAL